MRNSGADPTASPALRQLKEDLLADSNVARYLEEIRKRRVALVLSGGGGKGAYEAGSLLALFDCGITEFCAVAGTSVGALNGALFLDFCKAHDRQRFLQLWCDIAPSKVLGFTPHVLLKALTLAITVLAGLFTLALRPLTQSPQEEEARDATAIRLMVFERPTWSAAILRYTVIGIKSIARILVAVLTLALAYHLVRLSRGGT